MTAERIFQSVKREFGELFKEADITNLFLDILNQGIKQITSDLRCPTKTSIKDVPGGIYKVLCPENTYEIMECLWQKMGEKYYMPLQKDNITTILNKIDLSGEPYYWGILVDENKQFICVVPVPQMNYRLMILYKHNPDLIKGVDEEIPLPSYTNQALEYFIFAKFSYNFLPTREQYYITLYQYEIQRINTLYGATPRFVGHKEKIIYWQEY